MELPGRVGTLSAVGENRVRTLAVAIRKGEIWLLDGVYDDPQLPKLPPPAVWLPYKKAGQSATDIVLDDSGGRFGPFDGQLFVGEFTLSGVNRVFLKQVGQYQGACFPFRSGFTSAVLRLAQGTDGSLFAGLTNRGWSSAGTASYGLQRLVWTGKTPFEIKELRARPDGFQLVFTQPVDLKNRRQRAVLCDDQLHLHISSRLRQRRDSEATGGDHRCRGRFRRLERSVARRGPSSAIRPRADRPRRPQPRG